MGRIFRGAHLHERARGWRKQNRIWLLLIGNSSFQPIDLSIIIARIGFTSSLLLLNTVIGKAEGGDVSANCLIMQTVELPMQSTAKSLKVITIMIDNSPFLVYGEIFAYFGIKHLRIRWNLALGAKSNMRRGEKLQSFSPLWSWSYHNPKATLEWSPKALLMLVEGKEAMRRDARDDIREGTARDGEDEETLTIATLRDLNNAKEIRIPLRFGCTKFHAIPQIYGSLKGFNFFQRNLLATVV